ncbi:zinc-binding dehydrogenase [Leifsonia sp. NPDC056665]|uniref:zinc-binding dehydrogenase n=1 Tax=Leifsonia sp. NPDC056665 TaxID=3345901 RepID=UPI0036A352AE
MAINEERLEGTALVAYGEGSFGLESIRTGPLTPDTIGIETAWSGVSFGSEFAVLRGKLNWGSYPLVTGYMGAGRVVHVGSRVDGYSLGDRVYYRANPELALSSGAPLASALGVHASVAVIDPRGDHGADHIPDSVPDDLASTFVLPAVGLNGVNDAGVSVGDTVVVIGVGMIGLAVVAAAAERGARILAIDIRDHPLEVASKLGAHWTVNSTQADAASVIRDTFGPDGVDYVFESTGTTDAIDLGISLLRDHGTFVWQGNYGQGKVSFQFLEAHYRRVRMLFPSDDGLRPCRRAVLDSMGAGRLRWDATITNRIESDNAPDFYRGVYDNGLGGVLGASIRWDR